MDQEQEESEEEEKGRGAQMGSLLRRGLRIGKKVAIAGAAISSAPVVIPPLVVGLAFAFPFGIYFAGFVCTDKLMRALLSDPSSVVVVHGDSQEEEEEFKEEEKEKDSEIDIWQPTIMVEDEEKLNEQDKLGIVGSKWLVEEKASKEQNESTEKRRLEMQRDEPATLTVEHGIEMWPPTTNIDITRDEDNMEENTIRFKYGSSLDDQKDIIQDGGVEEERLMQVERQTEEKEQQRNREENEKGRENINEQQIMESSDYPFSVDDIGTELGEKVNGKVENEKGDGEAEEFQYTVTEVSIMTSDESDKVTRQTKFVGYEKETEVDTVNQIKLVLEGRSKGIEDAVTDLETEGYLMATDHSLASVPEDWDIDSKRSDLSSEHAFSATSYKVGGNVKPIEIDRVVMGGESEGRDRSTAILNRETDVVTAYDSVVVAPSENEREIAVSSMSTEYASAVQDHSLDMTDAECGPAKIVVETAEVKEFDDEEAAANEMKQTEVMLEGRSEVIESEVKDISALVLETKELLTDVDYSLAAIPEEKPFSTDSYEDGGIFKPTQVEGGVTGEENVGNYRSPALSNSEDHVITACDYFIALAPLKSERGTVISSMSTEYASAVGDHSSDVTYAESGPAKMIVGAAVGKESDDEKETTVDKVKPKEVKSEERSKVMVDEVKDMAPLVLEEAEDLLTAVNHSLAAIPEDSAIDSRGRDLGSENTFSTTGCNEGGGINKPMHVEGRVTREENVEIDRSTFTLNREDHVVTAYHSVAVAPLEGESDVPVPSMSADFASAVEDHSSDMTDAETGNAKIIVETVEVERSDDEVVYSQEMIWEQLHAMRTIVGYKAVACSSLVEELKALYLFTGVEPPVSLKDTSDLVEIGDKLEFLKAVIGVK